jgi:hypothetical protein
MVSATHTTHRGARGRGGRQTVTSRCNYYSTTSNRVKLLSVPESPSPELYATAAVQVWQLLSVECHSLANVSVVGGSTPTTSNHKPAPAQPDSRADSGAPRQRSDSGQRPDSQTAVFPRNHVYAPDSAQTAPRQRPDSARTATRQRPGSDQAAPAPQRNVTWPLTLRSTTKCQCGAPQPQTGQW